MRERSGQSLVNVGNRSVFIVVRDDALNTAIQPGDCLDFVMQQHLHPETSCAMPFTAQNPFEDHSDTWNDHHRLVGDGRVDLINKSSIAAASTHRVCDPTPLLTGL